MVGRYRRAGDLSVAQNLTPISVQDLTPAVRSPQVLSFIPVDTSAGNVIVTLPTSPLDNSRIEVKMVKQGGSNTVTITAGGSNTFNDDASTSVTLKLLNQAVMLQYSSSATAWYVQSDDLPLSQLDARYLASNGVAVTGTPSSGQVLTATSGSAAVWSAPTGGSVQTLSATANAVQDTNAYCSPNSHNVSSTSGLYTQGMVGLTAVFIQGGSGGTSDLVTTVQSVTDSNHLVLTTTVPGGTGNPQTLIIGTDISSTLATAFINAGSAHETLFIPAGTYLKTSTTTVPSNVTIIGAGRQETIIIHASSTTSAFTGIDLTSIIFSDWTVNGPGQGVGSGSGINFTLSSNPATYYPTLVRFSASQFGIDGIAIATPIVGRFDQVVPEHNGRHGFNVSGAGQADGTSCSFTACFPAGNWAAGYYLHQMAYTTLNGCAGDANGVGYYYDTCIGITENGCGTEETYNFNLLGKTSFTPNGLSRYVSNSKVVMNSPFMIQNVGTACYITNSAKVTISDYYEGSPGNSDDPNSNPTASLKVDSGSSVVVNNYSVITAMSLATSTTVLLPDALNTTATASQQTVVSSDQSLSASSSNTVLSLTLTTGKWLVTGTVTLQQGATAGNTDCEFWPVQPP